MTARLLVPLATALLAALLLTVGPQRPAQPLLRATAGGDMQLQNSRDGQAILSTTGLRPGGSAEGTLTISNRAPAPQHLTLRLSDLADTPGPGGGILSQRLDLRSSSPASSPTSRRSISATFRPRGARRSASWSPCPRRAPRSTTPTPARASP
jgi:hypothetical protein